MRRDFVIFHFENNKIDNAVRRCLRNKTKPFYCEIVLVFIRGGSPQPVFYPVPVSEYLISCNWDGAVLFLS